MKATRNRKLIPAPEVAARSIVQVLVATGKRYTVDGLREKLRECFKDEGNWEIRSVAVMTNVELISAMLEANATLAKVGLQLNIVAGVVSLNTTKIESERLKEWIVAHAPRTEMAELSQAALEVLACIAFKQPICQAEVDRYFKADKRAVVHRLREMGFVTEFAGKGGRFEFATTEAFLRRFNLETLESLHVAAQDFQASALGE